LTFFHPAGIQKAPATDPRPEPITHLRSERGKGGIFDRNEDILMKDEQELVLKATKEIVVKFIEVGRLSVSSFAETRQHIFTTVQGSLDGSPKSENQ
jgi:hypothetical protein